MIFVKHLCVTQGNVSQLMHVNVQLVMVIVLNVNVVYGIMVSSHDVN